MPPQGTRSEPAGQARPHSVGVVGLGAMGAPIAVRLAARGFAVRGYDSRREAVAAAATEGVVAADELDALAACDVVIVCVPSDDDVAATGNRLCALMQRDAILAICSSTRPETCRQLGARAAGRGVSVVDAALTGGVRAAQAGSVHVMAGGDPDVIGRLRPVLDAFSTTVAVLGPLGAGQVGKTVNNLLHWSAIAAITEALELGERCGVPAPRMRAALLDGPADSRALRELEHFRLTWWLKDLTNALAMAREAGAALPLAEVVRNAMPEITPELLRTFV